MAVDNPSVIDVVGIEKQTRDVILTISDHLPWDADEQEHLLALQSKLNTYIHFIQSKQLLAQYPDAIDLLPVISVVGKHPLSKAAAEFFDEVGRVLDDLGISLRFVHHHEK